MRTRIALLSLLFFATGLPGAFAAAPRTATPSALPTDSEKTKQIEDFKERLATKVAQLRTVERKAVYGTVVSTSITSIVIENPTKNIKIELTDDITVIQFLKGKRTKLTTEDIAKGDPVTVFGELDQTLDLIRAKVIVIEANAKEIRVSGRVSNIDRNEFTATVTMPSGQNYIVDIEKTTKISRFTTASGVEKWGFSKMTVGDMVAAIGSPVPKKDLRLSASRIIDLGNLSSAPPTPETEEKPESTSSGVLPTGKSTKAITPTEAP